MSDIEIPSEEAVRQAIDSLRGYAHQLYSSLSAWLSLEEDEILLLEVAEDYAVIAANAQNKPEIIATQIKDVTSASFTTNSPSFAAAVQSFWNLRSSNAGKTVELHYLTTAPIGREKSGHFPGKVPGITYWRTAAREGSDVEPIRTALLNLEFSDDLVEFIKESSPEEFRQQLLKRIKWECECEREDQLHEAIKEKLIYLGTKQPFAVAPSDSEKAFYPLLGKILSVVIKKEGRRLTRSDLLRIFEESTSILIPLALVRNGLGTLFTGLQPSLETTIEGRSYFADDVSQISLPRLTIERNTLLKEISQACVSHGAAWISGSSGLGKTTLAIQHAQASKAKWFLIQLRDLNSNEVEMRLRDALRISFSKDFAGIILDDFPVSVNSMIRLRLSVLIGELRAKDAAIIITSYKGLHTSLRECFGASGTYECEVPYLKEEEVEELIYLAGGDGKKWGAAIHAFCGLGHPQLIAARIFTLSEKNWPASELRETILAGGRTVDIASLQEELRNQLISEISENSRELLYRLSIIGGSFDRNLALEVASCAPPVARPGETIDYLTGPWIETRANGRLSISPLLSNAGLSCLSPSAQKDIHDSIVQHLIAKKPFPANELNSLLIHSLAGKNTEGLMWIAMGVVSADAEIKPIIAQQLFLLPLLGHEQEIIFDNPEANCLFRIAQIEVASELEQRDNLQKISQLLLIELQKVRDELKAVLFLSAIGKIVSNELIDLQPREWLVLLKEFENLTKNNSIISSAVENFSLRVAKENDEIRWSISQFLFTLRACKLQSIDKLEELFTELDKLDPDERAYWLASFNDPQFSVDLFINSAWLVESRQDSFDGRHAASKFERLASIAQKWGAKDLEIECVCAQIVMLNEYAKDTPQALELLESAQKKHPDSYRLKRQKNKILFLQGDHEAALKEYQGIATTIEKRLPTEEIFVTREAAVSAMAIQNYSISAELFSSAYAIASKQEDSFFFAMSAGLIADIATAEFLDGNYRKAVVLIGEALKKAEKFDNLGDATEIYRARIIGHIIQWMRARTKLSSKAKADLEANFTPGWGSILDPAEGIKDFPYPPLKGTWYQLAELESDLGLDVGILDSLQDRLAGGVLVLFELPLRQTILLNSIKSAEAETFLRSLHSLIAAFIYFRQNKSVFDEMDFTDSGHRIMPTATADWGPEEVNSAKEATLAFIIANAMKGRAEVIEEIKKLIENDPIAATFLNSLFVSMTPVDIRSEYNPMDFIQSHIESLLSRSDTLTPDEAYMLCFYLFRWIKTSKLKLPLMETLANWVASCWNNIISNQKIGLKNPSVNAPAIQEAINSLKHPAARIASILLSAEAAVYIKLSSSIREELREDEKEA